MHLAVVEVLVVTDNTGNAFLRRRFRFACQVLHYCHNYRKFIQESHCITCGHILATEMLKNVLKLHCKLHPNVNKTNMSHTWDMSILFTLCDPCCLTPLRCEIPRCHGYACDLLVCVRDLCTQATKSSRNVTSVHKTVRCVKLTFG